MISFLSILLTSSTLFSLARASCESPIITSQADADAISNCTNIDGTLTIAANAEGDIRLDGIVTIEGNFTNADCSLQAGGTPAANTSASNDGARNCGLVKSISSSTLKSVGTSDSECFDTDCIGSDFAFRNLANLTKLDFPALETVGNLHLINLPSLEELHLNLSGTDGFSHVVKVHDVALSDGSGLNFWWLDLMSISGIPNMNNLELHVKNLGNLTVSGNGNLAVSFNETVVSNFSLSGCNNFKSDLASYFHSVNLTQNTFTTFDYVTGWGKPYNVYIADNPQLQELQIQGLVNFKIEDVYIARNPKLSGWLEFLTDFWTADSIFVEGNFTTFSLSSRLSMISNGLTINSSNPGFSCAGFDELRKDGHIQGTYECQSKTTTAGAPNSSQSSAVKSSAARGVERPVVVSFALSALIFAFLLKNIM